MKLQRHFQLCGWVEFPYGCTDGLQELQLNRLSNLVPAQLPPPTDKAHHLSCNIGEQAERKCLQTDESKWVKCVIQATHCHKPTNFLLCHPLASVLINSEAVKGRKKIRREALDTPHLCKHLMSQDSTLDSPGAEP